MIYSFYHLNEGGSNATDQVNEHLDQDELKKRMKTSSDREQFQRWQSIFLTGKGLSSEAVAEYVGCTKGTIHQWVYHYNHEGPDGFLLQGRGGRRFGLLTLDEESLCWNNPVGSREGKDSHCLRDTVSYRRKNRERGIGRLSL